MASFFSSARRRLGRFLERFLLQERINGLPKTNLVLGCFVFIFSLPNLTGSYSFLALTVFLGGATFVLTGIGDLTFGSRQKLAVLLRICALFTGLIALASFFIAVGTGSL